MKRCRFCAEEIQDAAIVCKHCGRDLATATEPKREKSSAVGKIIVGVLGVGILLAFIGGLSNGNGPKELTAEHRAAIENAHKPHAWILPSQVELSNAGFVVADYEYPRGVLIPAKVLGETRATAIREALRPFGFTNIRVNVNGPSPGRGLVERHGSARIINGGAVEWLTP